MQFDTLIILYHGSSVGEKDAGPAEPASSAKKKPSGTKSNKKQSTKKVASDHEKQKSSSKGASNSRSKEPNKEKATRDKTSSKLPPNFPPGNLMGALPNSPYALGGSMGAPLGSVNSGTSSVYGYGGLPIAPPPNGNTSNFLAGSSHIPPAQRAGPYIPYFPQACKPSYVFTDLLIITIFKSMRSSYSCAIIEVTKNFYLQALGISHVC